MVYTKMAEFGCRYMWVPLNKQDYLAEPEREAIFREINGRFESEISQYTTNLLLPVYMGGHRGSYAFHNS